MGVLTESMTRLRDEIAALRRSRQALRVELARSAAALEFGVAALRRAVAAEMEGARRAWRGAAGDGAPSRAQGHGARQARPPGGAAPPKRRRKP